jgi:hypothetical protein
LNNWELKKEPVANTSAGDSKRLVEKYKENGCKIYEHPYEYRSVHYVILFERSKIEKVPVEIQVRTVLEEAWSEIDHLVRYPYKDGHRIYSPYLSILNQLIAQADEISSLIYLLKTDDNHRLMKSQNAQQVNEKVIADISKQLNKFRIRKDQKKALKNQLKLLQERISKNRNMQDGLHSADKARMYTPHLLGTDPDEVSQDKS